MKDQSGCEKTPSTSWEIGQSTFGTSRHDEEEWIEMEKPKFGGEGVRVVRGKGWDENC